MKRVALYSNSNRSRAPLRTPPSARGGSPATPDRTGQRGTERTKAAPAPSSKEGATEVATESSKWRRFLRRFERPLLLGAGAAIALVLASLMSGQRPVPRQITQEDIDAAVLRTFETKPLPSRPAKAAEIIRPSVVRVKGLGHGENEEEEDERGVGSGVVVVDKGIILTNLHVVAGAKRVKVVFFDGMESEATVISVQPENDLAVLQAKTIPDDLVAATLTSTNDLLPGDEVVAVGFPFGIGPSVTAGVVSGLKREFQSPEGKRLLTNLIQFDAAANPGSSGGPLVTMQGEVVGIVTAILNPTSQRVFVGIGFAVPIENAAGAVGMSPM